MVIWFFLSATHCAHYCRAYRVHTRHTQEWSRLGFLDVCPYDIYYILYLWKRLGSNAAAQSARTRIIYEYKTVNEKGKNSDTNRSKKRRMEKRNYEYTTTISYYIRYIIICSVHSGAYGSQPRRRK